MRRRMAEVLAGGMLLAALLVVAAVAVGPLTGQWRIVPVLSGSMRPVIAPGDAVVATPAPADQVVAGDVILFHPPGESGALVVHRVTRVMERGRHPVVRTAGDASAAPDPWAARLESDTVWRVRHVVPRAGWWAVVSGDRWSGAGALAVVVGVLLASALRRVWSEPAEERHPDAVPVA